MLMVNGELSMVNRFPKLQLFFIGLLILIIDERPVDAIAIINKINN